MRMSTLPTWSRTTTRTSSREKGVYREWSTELDVVGNVTEVVCSLFNRIRLGGSKALDEMIKTNIMM